MIVTRRTLFVSRKIPEALAKRLRPGGGGAHTSTHVGGAPWWAAGPSGYHKHMGESRESNSLTLASAPLILCALGATCALRGVAYFRCRGGLLSALADH
jgi:hypothetical protein